jgi:hypothetical protein
MKRKALALVLITVVALSVTAWFVYSQISELQNQINVKITNFAIDKQWWYLGGVACDCRFNMTIENKGVSNVTGLELKVKLFNNGSEVQVGNYFFLRI